MATQRDRAWVGIDVGKTHHWACVVDADGKKLLSMKVANDEADIVALIADAYSPARQPVWAVDIIGSPSALLLLCWLEPMSRCDLHPGESSRR